MIRSAGVDSPRQFEGRRKTSAGRRPGSGSSTVSVSVAPPSEPQQPQQQEDAAGAASAADYSDGQVLAVTHIQAVQRGRMARKRVDVIKGGGGDPAVAAGLPLRSTSARSARSTGNRASSRPVSAGKFNAKEEVDISALLESNPDLEQKVRERYCWYRWRGLVAGTSSLRGLANYLEVVAPIHSWASSFFC